MKLSKMVAGPVVALLLGLGLVASGGAMSASAGAMSAVTRGPVDHMPVICKMGGGASYDGTGICGRKDQNTGGPKIDWDTSLYKYYDDIPPFAVLADPVKFPASDGGLNCKLEDDGNLRCWRYVRSTATAGKDDCTLTQLKDPASYACRGSVVEAILEKDEATAAGGKNYCTPETIYYGKNSNGQPRYYSLAMQCYDGAGLPTVPDVVWYKADGKGKNHAGTYIGYSRGYLTADPTGSSEPANTVTVSSTMSRSAFETIGGQVDYSVTLWADTAGSAVVNLAFDGLKDPVEGSVPTSWIRTASKDPSVISYVVPHINTGAAQTATLHFTVDSYRGVGVTATANDASSRQDISVTPEAPMCTTPGLADGHPIAIAGPQATILAGLHCAVASDATLEVFVPAGRDIKKLSIDDDTIRYVPPTDDFHGEETLYVLARNPGGIASAPTAVTVEVVDKATPVADEYTVPAESRTVLDAAHGLMANDTFPGGSEGWSVVSSGVEADGAIRIGEQGELEIEAPRHFTGDLTFEYKLTAPHGQGTEPVTVTIHVVE